MQFKSRRISMDTDSAPGAKNSQASGSVQTRQHTSKTDGKIIRFDGGVRITMTAENAPDTEHPPPPVRLPRKIIAALAVGNYGVSMLVSIYSALLVYFYLPPQSANIPGLVTDSTFLGILNAIVLIAAAGRLTDSITDILIAGWSDRCTHRRGRRIPFMAVGLLPACASLALLFFPPNSHESTANIVYLLLMQIVFFVFLTAYLTPAFALVADIGGSPDQRLTLTIVNSVAGALGIITSSMVFVAVPRLERQMSTLRAWQVAIAVASVLAAVTMAVPVLVIDERKYVTSTPTKVPLAAALRQCLRNSFFRPVLLADFINAMAVSIIQMGLLYYVTVLLELETWFATVNTIVLVLCSLLLYPLVPVLARLWGGGKRLLFLAFALGVLCFVDVTLLGLSSKLRGLQAVAPVIVFAAPYAILTTVVFWITSDIAVHASKATGESMAGMFFATRYFFLKLGVTLGTFIFAVLLQLGRDVGDDLGIRVTGAAGAFLHIMAAVALIFFDEKRLQRELAESENTKDFGYEDDASDE